jgi:hypothetical protein
MLVSSCGIWEDCTAKANILRILFTSQLVSITLCSSIHTAKTEHVECLHETHFAELAFVDIRGVLVTCHCMGIPSLRIGKKVSTKARVGRIVLATYCMVISQGFAIHSYSPHHAKRCYEILRTVKALEAIGRIRLTCHGMLVSGRTIRKDSTAEASVARIIWTTWHMSISQKPCILSENATC